MKPPNLAAKNSLESTFIRNTSERIKKIMVIEYKQVDLNTVDNYFNHLKDKFKDSFLKLSEFTKKCLMKY